MDRVSLPLLVAGSDMEAEVKRLLRLSEIPCSCFQLFGHNYTDAI